VIKSVFAKPLFIHKIAMFSAILCICMSYPTYQYSVNCPCSHQEEFDECNNSEFPIPTNDKNSNPGMSD
jgi:hypothetical protein